MAMRRGKLQKVGDDVLGIALTSHAPHFHGDKMLWLREHMVAINWSGCEAVAVYAPEPKRRRFGAPWHRVACRQVRSRRALILCIKASGSR